MYYQYTDRNILRELLNQKYVFLSIISLTHMIKKGWFLLGPIHKSKYHLSENWFR